MEQETRGQEMPELLMYRHSWKPFFEYVGEICLFHWCSPFFLVKSKTSGLGVTLKCQIVRISRLVDDGLKEFLLYLFAVQSVSLFQISSLLSEKAQTKQYKTLLEGLEHEKKQLETKVGEMQKTAAQSQLNANNDGKSNSIRYYKYSVCSLQIMD